MSTRSLICIEREADKIETIYCHFDGYLDGVGKTLAEHYTDPSKVDQLFALGDLSQLGEEIGVAGRAACDGDHNMCVAYHRDRGEPKKSPRVRTASGMEKAARECWAEFVYIFKAGQWHYLDAAGLSPLAEVVAKTDEAQGGPK